MQPSSIEEILSPESPNLYFFFGGIASGIVMPPFEFYQSSKITNDSKIFFRDLSQTWYQNGLPELGYSLYAIHDYIQKKILERNPDNIYFIGNSMGGYAAILFSALIGKGTAIAFAPQTFISPYLRFKYHDHRWKDKIIHTYKTSFFKRKSWDLKKLLHKKKAQQKIHIFVSRDDALDLIHARHLEDLQNVSIFEFSQGGHGVVKYLKELGKLPEIMSGNYIHDHNL